MLRSRSMRPLELSGLLLPKYNSVRRNGATLDGSVRPAGQPRLGPPVVDRSQRVTKVFNDLACSSHNAMWDRRHLVLFQASVDWLNLSSVSGVENGTLRLGD